MANHNNTNNNHNHSDDDLKDTTTYVNDDDDNDSALDPSEQTQRPADTALNQQRVNAWHPILDPVWCTIALFYLGVILIPTGTVVILCIVFFDVCVIVLFCVCICVWLSDHIRIYQVQLLFLIVLVFNKLVGDSVYHLPHFLLFTCICTQTYPYIPLYLSIFRIKNTSNTRKCCRDAFEL